MKRIAAVSAVLVAFAAGAQPGFECCWGLSAQDQSRRQGLVAKGYEHWLKEGGGQYVATGGTVVLTLSGGAYRWAGLKTNRAYFSNPRLFLFPEKHRGGTLAFTAFPMSTAVIDVERYVKVGGQIWALPSSDERVDFSPDGSKNVYGLGVRVEVWVAPGVASLDVEARLNSQISGAGCQTSDRVMFSVGNVSFAEGRQPTTAPPSSMVTVPRTTAPAGVDQRCLDILQELDEAIDRALLAGTATRDEMSAWLDKIREAKGCLKK